MSNSRTENFLEGIESHRTSVLVEGLNHRRMQATTHRIGSQRNIPPASACNDGNVFPGDQGPIINPGYGFPGLKYPSAEMGAATLHSSTVALPPQALMDRGVHLSSGFLNSGSRSSYGQYDISGWTTTFGEQASTSSQRNFWPASQHYWQQEQSFAQATVAPPYRDYTSIQDFMPIDLNTSSMLQYPLSGNASEIDLPLSGWSSEYATQLVMGNATEHSQTGQPSLSAQPSTADPLCNYPELPV